MSDQPWLSVAPTSGTAAFGSPPTPHPLTISANVINPIVLGYGVYTGHVVVSAPGAADSPQTITVTLNVGGTTLGGFALIGVYSPVGP